MSERRELRIVEVAGAPRPMRFEGRELVVLPPKVARQQYRPAQSNIPDDRAVRDSLKRAVRSYLERVRVVPPMPLSDLREHALAVVRGQGLDEIFADYTTVLVNNELWRDELARVPYEKRLMLVPKCLRVEEHCPAPFDEFGLLCKECGLCSLHDLTVEAERLGYAVLVAEGSALVTQMIASGRIEAIVGVSCLNVLEKCYPHMEAAAIPGVSIPLLQDDCVNTTLDLDALRESVAGWFEPASLDRIMGEASGDSERIARQWLARAGKRWRPYLACCAHVALRGGEDLPEDLKKLAVAVECFHKASLIHDDIEDEDEQRYGEPALHAEHGTAVALNVGDLLLGEGYRLLAELDVAPETRVAMLRAAAVGHVTLSRGQGAELVWARQPAPLKSVEVLQIFKEKTAPAFEVALRLGALYAGADDDTLAVLEEYSESLGIAYQIRDDIEDFTGGGDSDDLERLRPSLLLAIAHKRAEGEDAALVEALWRRERELGPVAGRVERLLRDEGVIGKAEDLLAAYEEQAVRSLRLLESPTLKGLLRRVVGKIFGQRPIEGYCGEFEARNAAGRAAGAAAPAGG